MKQPKLYTVGLIQQINRCLLLVRSPKKFMAIEKETDGINVTLVTMNISLLLLCNLTKVLEIPILWRISGWGISLLLYVLYSVALIWLSKGNIKINALINIALYIHLVYILINFSAQYALIGIVVYLLGHTYTVMMQIISLKSLFGCKDEGIKIIFYIEVGILVIGLLNRLLMYIGEQIIFSSNLLHYQLLG